jgi:recombination protein RecA
MAEFDIMYGKGISREGSLLDVGVDQGFVKKSGAWYTYEGEQLGQGRENAKVFLAENAEIMVELSERIRQAVGLGDKDEPEVAAQGDVDNAVADTAVADSAVAGNGAVGALD